LKTTGSKADKTRSLNNAQGSVEECRYYLIITKDLGGDIAETLLYRGILNITT